MSTTFILGFGAGWLCSRLASWWSRAYAQCKCDACGWMHSFRVNRLDAGGVIESYCDHCDEHRHFHRIQGRMRQKAEAASEETSSL